MRQDNGDGREAGAVLCRYFFQQMMVDEEAPSEEFSSSILLSAQPTLAELKRKFPFVGEYHFRLQRGTPDGNSYCWVDLIDEERVLPVVRAQIRVKVLQLSCEPSSSSPELPPFEDQDLVDVAEDRQFNDYFQQQSNGSQGTRPVASRGGYSAASASTAAAAQEVGAVLSGVKKALTSKMKHSGIGQSLQKKSAKMWDKVMAASTGAGMTNAPPTAAALAQLAKLMVAMKAPLTDSNREHTDFLTRLWGCCFEAQPFVLRGSPWERLGFEYQDPFGELQCLLPLQCLVFFHEVHRAVALPMVNEQATPNNPDTYPYALVASQVAFVLTDLLQLRDGACLGQERPFWRLFEDPIAFFELFSVVFRAFDQSWTTRGHKSLEIGFHLDYATDFAKELLRRGPDSISSLVDCAHHLQKW